jgi:hypothetical protein
MVGRDAQPWRNLEALPRTRADQHPGRSISAQTKGCALSQPRSMPALPKIEEKRAVRSSCSIRHCGK